MTRARRGAGESERPMVTLLDPDGNEFTTGDLATVNALTVQGYSVKGATVAEAVEALAPAPPGGGPAPAQ